MRIHWYWPFARPEELEWAHATARPGDSIVVQVIDSPVAPEAGRTGSVEVVRDLPAVDAVTTHGLPWLWSRQRTYRHRAAARRRLWEREDFDLVHLHYVNRFTDAFVRLPHPLVMSVHDVTPHVPRLGRRLENQLLGRLYRRADALIVHHRVLADVLMRQFELPASIIHIVPHQVFPTGAPIVDPPDGPPVILFFGSLRPNKGIHLLGPMMDHLRDVDCRLVIAGGGDPGIEGAVRRLAESDPRITAEIGFISLERKRELFTQASLVVLPYTEFTSQSGVLHDAYGHGRPVVVTDVGALGYSVREDGTGIVVAPNDPKQLSAEVRNILELDSQDFLHHINSLISARSPHTCGLLTRDIYRIARNSQL